MVEKQAALDAIAQLKEQAKSRKFTQKFDLIFSLREFNIKKGDKIDDYLLLPHGTGRTSKFCALVGKELIVDAKKICDTAILVDDFEEWASNPRKIRKLVRSHHYFIAQANIMPQIAKTFGKYLGSVGRMPNPKLGQVIAPNADLKATVTRINKIAILKAKKQPNLHLLIANTEMADEDIWNNIRVVYDKVLADLPKGKQQLRHVFIKLTMSKPIILE
ncbi:hypothetical protein COT72_03220 [archaeon CG10_big_fil_rev_8_21_14_0_10_43_11]|nr:MAG: hypothetical protein COT72_03220 [archaeon CG10_big_fil_rev_8_21_14_0_10_43_11]